MVAIAKTSADAAVPAAARNRNTAVSGSQSLYNSVGQRCSTFVDSLSSDTAVWFLNIAINRSLIQYNKNRPNNLLI